MEEDSSPVEVRIEVEDAEEIATVFIGYEETDGTQVIVASAEVPASAELKGRQLQSGSDS